MRVLALIAATVLLVACAATERQPAAPVAAGEDLVWPPPPMQPRIRFLYAFEKPKDLGIGIPVMERLLELVVGARPRGMVRPYAIASDGTRIAVADPGLQALHLYDTQARKYERVTAVGTRTLKSPVGVAMAAGHIYLADSVLQAILVLNAQGELQSTIDGLARPTGLAYHHDTGRLYVAETLGHRIAVYSPGGERLFAFGRRGAAAGELNFPTHLFVAAGRLYVNDTMNFRIQIFDLDGRYVSSFGTHGDGSGHFAQPKGVAVDAEGHVYVVDALFNRVQIFDPQGRLLLAFGGEGRGHGRFWLPAGLFILKGQIYVADSYNRRVQVFEFLGGA